MQGIVLNHVGCKAKKIGKMHRRLCDSFLEHQRTKLEGRSAKHDCLEIERYKREFQKWSKLFTDECMMTVEDLNAALDGIT